WLRGISSSHSPHPDPLPGGEGTAAGSLALPDGLPTDSAPGYSKNRRTFLPLLGLRTQSRRKTKTFRAGVRARQSSESIIPTKGLHEGSSAPPVGVCFSGGIDSGSVFLVRSEEHTSELQSRGHLVCRLLLEKKKKCSVACPIRVRSVICVLR